MSKQVKKTRFVLGNQIWSKDHENLVKQLLIDGVIDPKDIRKIL